MSKTKKGDYSRRALIRFFSRMNPRKQPCLYWECPIAVAGYASTEDAPDLDENFVEAVDLFCANVYGSNTAWDRLTAARIVRIAREAPL